MSNIKAVVIKGKLPGKNLVVLIGVHGNEICGIKAADKLVSELEIKKGKVTFIYSNLEAIKQNKRFIDLNLNRCFLKDQPKEMNESLEGKTAREIMPFLEEADSLLDIHASNSKDSLPFVICDESQLEDASIFRANLVTFNWDEFEPGSTDYYMNIQGKEGFGFECGYLGDPKTQEVAEEAIQNFLSYFGATNKKSINQNNQEYLKIVGLYKNKNGPFKKSKEFEDFKELSEKTLVGKDKNEEIFAKKGEILLFVRDRDSLNEECFLTAKRIKTPSASRSVR